VSVRFVTSPAVILKRSDYSDTSLLVTAFSRDLGKVRLIAKGARRRKSPFAGLIDPLSHVELVAIPGRGDLYTLTECSPLGEAPRLRDELGRLSAALFVLALVDETQIDDDPQPDVFDLLVEALTRLDAVKNVPALLFAFQLRLIALSGYRLELDRCLADGEPLGGAGFFSPAHKGFLCRPCSRGLAGRGVSPGAFNLLKRLNETPLERVERVRISQAQTTELARLFDLVLATFLEKKLTVTGIIRKLGAPRG
jgi:DNA repair protein RecO (recombination protein O)